MGFATWENEIEITFPAKGRVQCELSHSNRHQRIHTSQRQNLQLVCYRKSWWHSENNQSFVSCTAHKSSYFLKLGPCFKTVRPSSIWKTVFRQAPKSPATRKNFLFWFQTQQCLLLLSKESLLSISTGLAGQQIGWWFAMSRISLDPCWLSSCSHGFQAAHWPSLIVWWKRNKCPSRLIYVVF